MDKLKDYEIINKMGGDFKAITLWRRCIQQVGEFGEIITKENRTWGEIGLVHFCNLNV